MRSHHDENGVREVEGRNALSRDGPMRRQERNNAAFSEVDERVRGGDTLMHETEKGWNF
jgi:hypothetical protein